MDDLLQVLIFKGYLIFFLWILVNRLGMPLPATPALLAAGALAGMGEWRIALVLLLAIAATLAADTVWFELGRRFGSRILRLVCRAALDPDIAVRRAESFLHRHGARSLLVSKFIPGMNRTMLPLTGTAHVGYVRFLIFDFFGALIWAGVYAGVGYVFSDTLEQAVQDTANLGWYLGALLFVIVLVGVIVWKYVLHRPPAGHGLAVELEAAENRRHRPAAPDFPAADAQTQTGTSD